MARAARLDAASTSIAMTSNGAAAIANVAGADQ
jgi:hypothetical protein